MTNSKTLYKDIFQLSKEIELLIQLENFDKVDMLLDKREILISQTLPEDCVMGEIKELVDRIKKLDEKNFEQLKNFKDDVGKRLYSVTQNKKCISMYKLPNHHTSNFVDKEN